MLHAVRPATHDDFLKASDDAEKTPVVVSNLNREGLTSLVDLEMFSDPREWLFDSPELALARIESLIDDNFRKDGPLGPIVRRERNGPTKG